MGGKREREQLGCALLGTSWTTNLFSPANPSLTSVLYCSNTVSCLLTYSTWPAVLRRSPNTLDPAKRIGSHAPLPLSPLLWDVRGHPAATSECIKCIEVPYYTTEVFRLLPCGKQRSLNTPQTFDRADRDPCRCRQHCMPIYGQQVSISCKHMLRRTPRLVLYQSGREG